jgi:sterol desaturase/sphingolipid hydroxylase (fatty acid hydroxylase superfamily)
MASTRHESIRLFENDLLERLSHVHPLTPLVFWGPVALWLLWQGITTHALGMPAVAALAVAGVFTWTLTEYGLHRFLFHGNHHEDPKDKTRLVMPPAGAIPIMAVLYLLFRAVLPAAWLEVFTAFFIVGYLVYDYIHYATHHFPMRNPVAKYLKHYHLRHHYAGQAGRYGVSSPLWDLVFGTRPAETPRAGR